MKIIKNNILKVFREYSNHEVDIYFHKEIETKNYSLENKDILLEKVREQIDSKL